MNLFDVFKRKKKEYNAADGNTNLVRVCTKKLAERIQLPMDKKKPVGVRFQYCKDGEPDDSEKTNLISLLVTKNDRNQASLQIGASREGTDRLYSNYLFQAGKTEEEIKAWLENTEVCTPIVLNYAKELSDEVDEYWS